MKLLLSSLLGAVLSLTAVAQSPNFTEDFEAGTLDNWTKLSPTSSTNFTISTYTNKVPGAGTYSALYTSSGAGIATSIPPSSGIVSRYDSARFSVWIYDWATNNNLRGFATVRSYTGGAYGSGSLNQVLAIGTYNGADIAPYVATNYSGRMAFGSSSGWFSLTNVPGKTAGWHHFEIERGTNGAGELIIKFYQDGMLGRRATNGPNAGVAAGAVWDSVSAGLVAGSTTGSSYFDGFEVVEGQAFIADEPQSSTNLVGSMVTLAVGAYGSASDLVYQWSKDGVPLNDTANRVGSATSTLTMYDAQGSDSGWYSVMVSNYWGARTSAFPARVEISSVNILTQPTNLVVNLGSNDVSFYCEATGLGLLDYQWKKDGTNIAGAKNSIYTIPVVGPSDLATNPGYVCVVSSGPASVTSVAATLQSNAPPVVGTLNLMTNPGAAIAFSIPVTDDFSSLGLFQTFENRNPGTTATFQSPAFSGTTSPNYVSAVNALSYVTNANFPPAPVSGTNVLFVTMNFTNDSLPGWDRLTTASFNPVVSFVGPLKFSVWTDRPMGVAVGLRETATTADIGQNGGGSGPIEFAGVTQGGTPPITLITTTAGVWTNIQFDLADPSFAQSYIAGSGLVNGNDGNLDQTTGKGVLECLALTPMDGIGVYRLYLDNFQSVPANGLRFALETAPQGATIDPYSGVVQWTLPATPGSYNFSVRVTDHLGLSTLKAFTVAGAIAPTPEPLRYQLLGGNLVLSWTNATFNLQSAGTITSGFTNIPNATSPFTNDIAGGAKFFRLIWP